MLVLIVELVGCAGSWDLPQSAISATVCPGADSLRVSLAWGGIGVASAAAGAAFLLSTHLRVMSPGFTLSALNFARIFPIAAGSGVAVALLEETVVRGAMHTAIERESGPWAAALLTARLYAVLHFFAKSRIAPQDVGWSSGFDLLLRSFSPLGHPQLVFDALLSWLIGGADLEPHARADRQHRRRDRVCTPVG